MCILHCDLAPPLYYVAGLQLRLRLWVQVIPLNINLVALNLAAPLNDGEEVYVVANGEIPPAYQGGVPGPGVNSTATTGQLVNINTASVDEMRQALHLSSTTAQNIINYRLQHGPYTSIDQLKQVVSTSTYAKIKNLVTI